MFTTDRLILRSYLPSDQDFFLGLLNTYNILTAFSSEYTAPKHGGHIELLESLTKCALFVVVVNKATEEQMGFTVVKIKKARNLDGDLGMALAEKWWGKRYGTELLQWVKGYAFKTLGLHRLSLFIFSSNDGAIAMCEKAGFQHEGRKREALWKEGQWVDIVWMGMLSKEY